MVVAYGFNDVNGTRVLYLNGPAGVTTDPNIAHVHDYYNDPGRGIGDAPNHVDGVALQYAGPTFESNQTGLLGAPAVIDNGDPGYSTIAFSEQGGVGDAFDNDQAYNANNSTALASYLFSDLDAGAYAVYATWRQNGQPNVGNAFFDISDGGGTVQVNQQIGPAYDLWLPETAGDWLGFEFLGYVRVDDGDLQVDLRPPSSGFVLADAVAIRQIIPEPGTIALLAAGMTALGGYLRKRRGGR